jgi:hypothetical protein
MPVAKTGTYYVSVEAPDAVDEDEPQTIVPVSQPYTLTLSRQKLKAKKPAAKKKTAKPKGK